MKRLHPNARRLIAQTWQSQANLSVFLILLVVSVFILPLLSDRLKNIGFYTDLVLTLMMSAGVAIAWGRRWLFAGGLAAILPTFFFRWLAYFVPSPSIILWAEACTLLAILMLGYLLLAQVFREGPINAMRVQGAVAAYLLLGVAYGHAYKISAYFNPTAITSTEGPMTSSVDWIYFSFSTLSTLGYGDILPTSHASRMLAIGEALSGQLFLAILIARLVAMSITGGAEKDSR